MIEYDGLKPGDKIMSERELSERLNVGRSSVREALRALELLGLIETRRGEGTFIRDFKGNQLVQLLGTFILQDQKARYDVVETKQLIEMDCLRLILEKQRPGDLLDFMAWVEHTNFYDEDFFLRIVEMADNHLLYRIWMILKDYHDSFNYEKEIYPKEYYLSILRGLNTNNLTEALDSYRKLRKNFK